MGGQWGRTRHRQCLQMAQWATAGRMMASSRSIPRTRISSPGLPAAATLMRNVQLSMKWTRSWVLDRASTSLAMISVRRTCSVGRLPATEISVRRARAISPSTVASTNIVNFNQDSNGDFGDWLSTDCPQANPYVQNAFGCTGQSSDIAATSPEGITLDVIGYDLSQVTLGNISTRGFVQTGDNVMIGGFIVQGTGPKTVIIRAIGPELIPPPYNIPNALADPTLELHNSTGALIGSNDNWQTTVIGGIITSNQVSAIQNSGHAPTQPSESAIIATLQPGNYTAIVRGVNNTVGVALVEVYDLAPMLLRF